MKLPRVLVNTVKAELWRRFLKHYREVKREKEAAR